MRLAICVLSCAVATGCGGRSPTGPTDAARFARLSRTRFVAFGDSLTSGEVTMPIGTAVTGMVVVPAASYPSVLQNQLQARYSSQASDITVINAGFGAETVVSGVLRFADMLDEHRPEVVLLMEGVNGLGNIGPDVSAGLIRSMTQAAKARGIRVFIASMLPTIAGRQRSQNAPLLELYNVRLREVCTLEGVTFVDLYGTLLPEVLDVIGIDGLHPTEAGYRRIADTFFTAIQRDLEQ
jgi:lysophospholipase L1-like esterase